VLLERSGGRPGILLSLAHKLFDRAADVQRSDIDGQFARELVGSDSQTTIGSRRLGENEIRDALALDDLLS
jgi:hypothetical protein